jgi:hypothetical protein
MNAGIYLGQGSTHAMCQDYAAVRVDEGWTAVALADGCSSSRDTDFGARLLVRSALRYAGLIGDECAEAFAALVVEHAARLAGTLKLVPEALDATLIVVKADGDRFRADIFGDGAVAVGYVDGRIELTSVEYPSNAPEYLSYRLDRARLAAYRQTYTSPRIVRRSILSLSSAHDADIADCHPADRPVTIEGDVDGVRWIAGMSDGIKSFSHSVTTAGSKGREPIEEAEVVRDLLDFVNLRGRFVERQAKWFLAQCEKRARKHADDVAVAAIAFGEIV